MEETVCDVGLERGILGGIARYGWDAFCDVDDLVQPTTFSADANRVIYRCLKYVFERDKDARIDQPTVENASVAIGLPNFFAKKDELEYLRAVLNTKVELQNIRKFAAAIRKLEIARLAREQLLYSYEDLGKVSGNEPLGTILGLMESRIYDFTSLLNDESKDPKPVGDDIVEYAQHLRENPREIAGISSGYPILDHIIGGGFRSGLNVIVARMKVGKTHLGMNFGLHISRNLYLPTLYLDTEMTKRDHQIRSMSFYSMVDSILLAQGQFGD